MGRPLRGVPVSRRAVVSRTPRSASGPHDRLPVKLLPAVLLTLLVLLLAANLFLWHAQERIVFLPTPPPHPSGPQSLRVDYRAADGQPLFAYVVGDRTRASDALIVFHGNADLAVNRIWWAEALARRTGVLVVVPEFRGYAGLPGAPTYEGAREDARAAYALVRDTLRIAPERISIYGHSLGSAIAAELATEFRPRALLLESPFTATREMVSGYLLTPHVPMLWRMIARLRWDTRARVAELDAPVWVAHGARDGVIPPSMGRAVHDAARRKGELLLVPEAGHNDVAAVGGEQYDRWLDAALAPVAERR